MRIATGCAESTTDLVFFDSICGFCGAAIRLLRRLDTGKRLDDVSLHDRTLAERFPEVTLERLHDEMLVLDRSGRQHWGAEAIRYLSRRLPTLWIFAPLLYLPGSMPLWRFLYRKVATNRYRISLFLGLGGSCNIRPTESPAE